MTSDSASTAGMQENGVEAMSSATNAEAMQERQALFAVLAQIAESLRRLFDPFCEVVIHDFSDFEHLIIHLEGNITNRKPVAALPQICCFPKHGAVTPMRIRPIIFISLLRPFDEIWHRLFAR
ncbi:MAG: PAS domain-containing protein [Caldilineaceae bacterium]